MLDVRLPIGSMFMIFGVILLLQGGLVPQLTEIPSPHGIVTFNLNLMWGVGMVVFAALMLGLAYAEKRQGHKEQ